MTLEFIIYQKPTSTSTITHEISYHLTERKMFAFNYLFNELNTYPLSNTNKDKELGIIWQMAIKND
jgi:hypothetical protein